MSAETAFGSAYPQVVGGETIDFPRLLMEDYGTLETVVRSNRRAVDDALLDKCNIVGPDRYIALRGAETKDVQPYDVDDYLITHAGATKALTMSLKKAGQTDEQAKATIAKMDHPTAINLARILIGFKIPSKPDEKLPNDERPLSPATGS